MVFDEHDIASAVIEARARSIALVSSLSPEERTVPYLATINPPLWELGHVAYFQELWVLRRGAGERPAIANADDLFDSISIDHEIRWRLPIPPADEVIRYAENVRDRTLALIDSGALARDERLAYLATYSVGHEDMHTEAFTYTRQSLGQSPPPFPSESPAEGARRTPAGDVEFPGGRRLLGARPEDGFCFDNEKWIHEVDLPAFAMSRTAVTEGEFAAFVEDGGYERRDLWSPQGWSWRLAENATAPLYWRRDGPGWERRTFDVWRPIDPTRAMMHVNYWEAEAFCRWARRRLPTEAEWETVATWTADDTGGARPRFPWGDAPGGHDHANLDWRHGGPVDVRMHAAGDGAGGMRQLIGNVWEWTSSTFLPYPGFVPDMYADYSQTSFATRKVLRGGCWATRQRLLRNTYRNYYQPSRRDVFAGFRTCSLES